MPERVSPQQREAEMFRWCVYCDADCEVSEPGHADWCPSSTGVFPVRVEWHCRQCLRGYEEPRIDPYACTNCGATFSKGDSYVHRQMPGMDDDVLTPYCLSCAAHEPAGGAA